MCKTQIKKYKALLISRNLFHQYNNKVKLNVRKQKKLLLENEI